jgi:hypothetical protein
MFSKKVPTASAASASTLALTPHGSAKTALGSHVSQIAALRSAIEAWMLAFKASSNFIPVLNVICSSLFSKLWLVKIGNFNFAWSG